MFLSQWLEHVAQGLQAVIVDLGGNHQLRAIWQFERALEVHLSHRATCTDEHRGAACAQFATIAGFTVRGGDVCAMRSDESDVIVMQATKVDLGESIERFCADKIACAASGDEACNLADNAGGCRVQYNDVIEANAVVHLFAESFIFGRSEPIALVAFCL